MKEQEEWAKRFRSKFNIAYVHDKGWAFLKEEVVDFIRPVRAEAVEEKEKELGKKFLIILHKLSNSPVSSIATDINDYMDNIHNILL